MATVFLAHDLKHDRPVPGGERLWFTMPYVEGESLRARLRRERQRSRA